MESLSLYRIFHTVARAGNISKAARELFISQPAISKAIKKLEEELGTTLFLRSPRGVTLTGDGEVLYRHIASAMSSIREGERELKRNRELGIGRLHLGVSTTLCKYIMLPILKQFVEENPHVTVTVECLSSQETAQRLAENKLDAGLVVETAAVGALSFTPFGELSYTFVATDRYLQNLKLRENVDYQKKEAVFFKAATLMLMDRENISRQHIENYFHEHNIETGQILETSNMELLVEFARIGLGVACVIRNLVEDDIKKGTLTEIPLMHSIPARTVGFAYSKVSHTNPAIHNLMQITEKM